MILAPGSARLYARTVSISDPGPLENYMTPNDSVCFLHRNYGMVGLGEVTRFETDSPAAADVWWEALCDDLEHETEMPGAEATGPVAFGSFTFDPDRSSSRSIMILPKTIIGRWPGYSWLTQLSWDSITDNPPHQQSVPRSPGAVTVRDGVVSGQSWRQVARLVQDIMGPGELDQIVLMRDIEAKAVCPIDPRWIVETLRRQFPNAYTYLVEGSVGTTSKLTVGVSKSLITSRVLTHSPATDANHQTLLTALQGKGPLASYHDEIVERTCARLEQFCDTVHVPDCPGCVYNDASTYLVTDVTGIHSPTKDPVWPSCRPCARQLLSPDCHHIAPCPCWPRLSTSTVAAFPAPLAGSIPWAMASGSPTAVAVRSTLPTLHSSISSLATPSAMTTTRTSCRPRQSIASMRCGTSS